MRENVLKVNKIKPRVGIVFSESATESNESKNLAYYIACSLIVTGHASVFLVGLSSDGNLSNLPDSRRITFLPPRKNKLVEVPASDISHHHFSILESCHVVIVTSNRSDNSICATKLIETLQTRKDIMVFLMQRGVLVSDNLKDMINGKSGITCLECAVGFAVIQHPRTQSYVSTIYNPSLAMIRLPKEVIRVAEGPVNLLETMNIYIFYRKSITTHEWGVNMYENIYALNAITGGTIADTLRNHDCRRIYATMIRESSKILARTARYGKWTPNMELISWSLTPWILEISLLLPWPIFQFISIFTGYPTPEIISPGLADMMDGRRPMTLVYISKLLSIANAVNMPAPVCEIVHAKLNEMIEAQVGDTAQKIGSKVHLTDLQNRLAKDYDSDTRKELNFWLMRSIALVSLIFTLYFFFIHD